MLHILLTTIRLFFKLIFLPIRAALQILAFALKVLMGIGSIPTTILSGIMYIAAIVALIEGNAVTDVSVWMPFAFGLLCSAFPYIGAVVVAIPLTIAELLKRLTSPHPFQDLELEGGKTHA